MTKYILLDAVLAEIENLLDKGKYYKEYDCAYRDGNNGALYALKGKLNTLEVKDVDFDAEWERYFEHRGEMATVNVKHLAKHFFELGLKASCSVDLTPDLDTLFEEKGIDPYSKEAKIFKEAICKATEKYFIKAQKGE